MPKRKLTFHIEVTDEGKTRFGLGSVMPKFENWRRIGKLTFDNAVASYNGDFVIHFNHPAWRADRNNPATAHRARRPLASIETSGRIEAARGHRHRIAAPDLPEPPSLAGYAPFLNLAASSDPPVAFPAL